MTATIILVRHAAHDLLGGVLTGRMSGVSLNATGRAQAEGLSKRLSRWRITAIHTGPLTRSRETARPLERHLGLSAEIDPAFDEIDGGAWTGRDFASLRDDARWRHWNENRGLARCPDGESTIKVQARVACGLEHLERRYPDQAVVVISHADVIKLAICHVLGLSADFHDRFEIDPVSLSVLLFGDWGGKILTLNEGLAP